VYLDFADAIRRLGEDRIRERYGNLFDMYEKITGENAYQVPMRIFPAPHYTMGGLWVDYNLMSNVPGLFVIGEANFSDQGANRLGASALMQGLADGYFVLPATISGELSKQLGTAPVSTTDPAFQEAEEAVRERQGHLLGLRGSRTADWFHRKLGRTLWEYCGMARNAEGLAHARKEIAQLREEFWSDVNVPGDGQSLNQSLEKAGRVADFIELGELLCQDAEQRAESCGCHFREESQTPDGEAMRNDADFAYVSAWEFDGAGKPGCLHKEPLEFESVHLTQRSYK
jgi:succinate dehydrogenase / fumarate reductase flavoprotein subunit